MSHAIELYRHDPLTLAQRWLTVPIEELRRTAYRAAHEGNLDMLCTLTFAHLTAYGDAGATVSAHTLRSYRTSIRQFVAYCRNNAVNLLRASAEAGRLWIRSLEGGGKAPSTVRVRLAGTRALYRALRWAAGVQTDPFIDVKAARDVTPAWEKRFPYQHEEIEQLLAAAPEPFSRLILLCAHGGLRISEALNLKRTDIALDDRMLTVHKGKGRKTRRVVMSQTLHTALAENGETSQGNLVALTYQAARQGLKILCQSTATTYRAWHSMRHYAGTRLIRETGDLERVARHLGHTDLATTRIYAKWTIDALHSTVGKW